LLVGINDDGSVRGVEEDLPLLQKADLDGWTLWLTDAVSNALGAASAAELNLHFCPRARASFPARRIRPNDSDPGQAMRLLTRLAPGWY
jgi:hypothetical protein